LNNIQLSEYFIITQFEVVWFIP